MTTYTTIANSDVDQDSPVTQPLMTALRDNPIAITEGSTGAPRIIGRAAATADEMPVLTVSAGTAQSIEIGVTRVGFSDTTGSSTYTTVSTITFDAACGHTGTARFEASHRALSSPGTVYLRLMKNGSQVAEWSNTSTTIATRSSDVSFTSGDVFVWQHRSNSIGVDSNVTAVFYPTANKAYVSIGLLIDSSEI